MFISNHYRRQQVIRGVVLFVGFSLLSIIVYTFFFSSSASHSPTLEPREVVKQFYAYEQAGDFGSSWELFHPLMQEKFSKQEYIQARARVFLQEFGVDTFDVKIGEMQAASSWKMSPKSPALADAQKVPVLLLYGSEFGDLQIKQDVYVAKEEEEEEYRILWPYHRDNG